jgi:predicted ATPase/DNA-binding SARP family transcriptional activator
MGSPTPVIRYGDLGGVVVERDGIEMLLRGRRLTATLGVLLVNVNQQVSTDTLIDALWGDQVPDGAKVTLDSHLYRIRKVLEPDRKRGQPFTTIVNDAAGYRLVSPTNLVDSIRFEELAGQARDLASDGQMARALTRSDEALGLWQGRPWSPHSDEQWASSASSRLEELHAQVRERRLECLLAVGDSEQAVADSEVLVAQYPLRERVWHTRMAALAHLGRTDDALDAYQQARAALVDALGIDPGTELSDLHQRILTGDPALAGPPRRVEVPRPTDVHLPRRGAALLGRDREIHELAALLGTVTCTTLVGTAGVGKSRLAIEAARTASDRFPDGVWYADVTATHDLAQVVSTLFAALGLEPALGLSAIAALDQHVRTRHMLLLVDSAPASTDAVVDLLETLTNHETETSFLVTSREPLNVADEHVFMLAPLSLPDIPGDEPADAIDLAAEPTVQLFVTRAVAVGAPVEPADLGTVAQICLAVDGLPLAIELAAAQTRSFSLAEVLQRVRGDSSTLRGFGRRHEATLAEVIQQSVDLIGDTELAVHTAASVIPGPFTPSTLAAVCGLSVNEVRNAVAGLVHRSLMVPLGARERGGPSRFTQLAAIRSHAQNTADTTDLEHWADRRNVAVTALVARVPRAGSPDERRRFQELDDDAAAVHATLQDLLVDRPDARGGYVAGRLGTYWYYRGRLVDWERWTRLGSASQVGDSFDRLQCGLSLAVEFGLAGRSDLSQPFVTAVDEHLGGLLPEQAAVMGESLFSVVSMARAARASELGIAATDRLATLAESSGDEGLALLLEVAHLLNGSATADPAETLQLVETAYARAIAAQNSYAAWSAATVGSVAALRAGQPKGGLYWSDRVLEHHQRLGVEQFAGPLTLRGTLLAMNDEWFDAAKMLVAARTQARRAGLGWPRIPGTWDVVSLAESKLSSSDLELATREGRELRLETMSLKNARSDPSI